jgi:hypothetical protein
MFHKNQNTLLSLEPAQGGCKLVVTHQNARPHTCLNLLNSNQAAYPPFLVPEELMSIQRQDILRSSSLHQSKSHIGVACMLIRVDASCGMSCAYFCMVLRLHCYI